MPERKNEDVGDREKKATAMGREKSKGREIGSRGKNNLEEAYSGALALRGFCMQTSGGQGGKNSRTHRIGGMQKSGSGYGRGGKYWLLVVWVI